MTKLGQFGNKNYPACSLGVASYAASTEEARPCPVVPFYPSLQILIAI